MRAPQTCTALTATHLLHALEISGVDPAPLQKAAGLSGPVSSVFTDRIPAATVWSLWESALQHTDSAFHLSAARIDPVDIRSPLSFLCNAAPDVGTALSLYVAFFPIVTDAYRWQSVTQGEEVWMVASPLSDRLGAWCNLEFDMLDAVLGARRTTGGRLTLRRVLLPHAPIAPPAHYAAAFGASVLFHQPRAALCFAAAEMAQPMLTADHALCAYLLEEAARLLQQLRQPVRVSERLQGVLALALEAGRVPEQDEAAWQLGMSARTLRRWLREERTSYRAVLDGVRLQLASDRLLSATAEEVALQLGYADVRAFRRAFVRWTGLTPGAWRSGQG